MRPALTLAACELVGGGLFTKIKERSKGGGSCAYACTRACVDVCECKCVYVYVCVRMEKSVQGSCKLHY